MAYRPRRGEKEWSPYGNPKWTEETLKEVFLQPPFVSYGDRWYFDYEYPGSFVYYHRDQPLGVYFTPDYDAEYGTVGLQIMNVDDGTEVEVTGRMPFLRDRRPETLFEIVKPYLDKYKDWTP